MLNQDSIWKLTFYRSQYFAKIKIRFKISCIKIRSNILYKSVYRYELWYSFILMMIQYWRGIKVSKRNILGKQSEFKA